MEETTEIEEKTNPRTTNILRTKKTNGTPRRKLKKNPKSELPVVSIKLQVVNAGGS